MDVTVQPDKIVVRMNRLQAAIDQQRMGLAGFTAQVFDTLAAQVYRQINRVNFIALGERGFRRFGVFPALNVLRRRCRRRRGGPWKT